MLYAWHLTPNSTSPHTILHLKRQHLMVSWSDGKFHLDPCMPDVRSYTRCYPACNIYHHKLLFPFGWIEKESHQKHFFSLLFYLVIHIFSVFLLTLFLHNSSYSKSTSHLFFPCLKKYWDLGINCGILNLFLF